MGRRGSGEGSVRKRPNGLYEARIRLPGQMGTTRRTSVYGHSRKEVTDKLTKIQSAKQQGTVVPPHRQTVKQFLEHWLDNGAKLRVRPRTLEVYRQHCQDHINPVLGHVRVQSLSAQQVQHLITVVAEKGLSPATVRGIRATLRVALNQAIRFNVIAVNPATRVDLPRIQQHEFRVLTAAEVKRFLVVAATDRLGCLFTVGVAVGLRLGEALGLGWEDVDLSNGTVRVRRALQRVNRKLVFVEPKSRKSNRTVPLPAFAVTALRQHQVAQKKERLIAGSRWKDSGLVFTSPIGTPLDASNVNRAFRALLKRAGLPIMRVHDLRHTCATLLLQQGVHPRVVMETLGHSQVSLTLDTYSHVIPSVQKEALQKLDALLA